MTKIPFEDGVLITPAKVTISGTDYEVTPAEYESDTPLTAQVLNELQDDLAIEVQNSTTTTTATSQEIIDCAGVKGKLDVVSGKTEQATNLSDGLLEQGTITNAGLIDSNTVVRTTNFIEAKAGTKIIVNATSDVNLEIMIKCYNSSKTWLGQDGWLDLNTENTLRANTAYIKITLRNKTTPSANLTPLDVTNLIVGPTPSPDYPQVIRNVGDNINLFDKDLNYTTYIGKTLSEETLSTGKKLTCTQTLSSVSQSTAVYKFLDLTNYVGKTITMKANFLASNSSLKPKYIIGLCDNNGTNRVAKDTSTTSGTAISFTVPTLDNVSKYLAVWLYITDNTTIALNDYVEFTNIKIEVGSTATPYTPYNCGSIDFKVSNKNKFNKQTTTDGYEISNGQIYSLSGWFVSDYIPIEYGKTYVKNNSSGNSCIIYDKNKNKISDNSTTFSNNKITISYEDAKYIRINNKIENKDTYQLEEGLTATTYTPHQEQNISFPLSAGQVLHEGDYLAEDGIHSVRKTITFDGTEEGWGKTGSLAYTIALTDIMKSTNPIGLSSHFIQSTTWSSSDSSYRGKFQLYVSSNSIKVMPTDETITTTELWKTWLVTQKTNGNPVKVEYELATEVVTDYTTEQAEAYYQLQHLQLYKGYTTIECIDEIKPDIKVEYLYDNDINNYYGARLDEDEEKIKEVETNLENLDTTEILHNGTALNTFLNGIRSFQLATFGTGSTNFSLDLPNGQYLIIVWQYNVNVPQQFEYMGLIGGAYSAEWGTPFHSNKSNIVTTSLASNITFENIDNTSFRMTYTGTQSQPRKVSYVKLA